MTRPAPAINPYTAQNPPTLWSLIWVAIQINRPATPAAISVVVARVSPYIRSPLSVRQRGSTPFCQTEIVSSEFRGVGARGASERVSLSSVASGKSVADGPPAKPTTLRVGAASGASEIDSPGVERRRMELCAELLHRTI